MNPEELERERADDSISLASTVGSYFYGPVGSALGVATVSDKAEIYTVDNYKQSCKFMAESKGLALDMVVSSLSVTLGTLFFGPIGAIVCGGITSVALEALRQRLSGNGALDKKS